MKSACEIIKELRTKNGFSQKALADQIGMTQQSIALIESGKRKVEFDLFVQIMDILKEPLVDIFVNYGIIERDIENKVGYTVCKNLDDSFDNILKAHGAYVFFDDNDNYTVKYHNATRTLTDDEYLSFKHEIEHYIEYSLRRLIENK